MSIIVHMRLWSKGEVIKINAKNRGSVEEKKPYHVSQNRQTCQIAKRRAGMREREGDSRMARKKKKVRINKTAVPQKF